MKINWLNLITFLLGWIAVSAVLTYAGIDGIFFYVCAVLYGMFCPIQWLEKK